MSENNTCLMNLLERAHPTVEWEEKTTESGIQIAEGPTTVKKKGTVLSSHLFPMPGQNGVSFMTIFLVLREDTGQLAHVDAGTCKVIRNTAVLTESVENWPSDW